MQSSGNAARNADYSLPAGRCWQVAEARRMSVRRAASRQSAAGTGAA